MNFIVCDKGTIYLGNRVIVSDPCYGLNTWCQGVLKNVLPGEWACKVAYYDERVASIQVEHKDYVCKLIELYPEDFEVGVDSGQAGIFDYEYYEKYHIDINDADHCNKIWYNEVYCKTMVIENNPNYKPFDLDGLRKIFNEEPSRATDMLLKYEEWANSEESNQSFYKADGNTIDGLGFVASSGYGDGGYTCWTGRNEDGNIVTICIEFIVEDED